MSLKIDTIVAMKFIKNFFAAAKAGFVVLFYAFKDKRTPFYAKFLTLAAMVYLVSPVDLIPDAFFPAGFLDDLAIVPALFYFVYKALPREVVADAEQKSQNTLQSAKTGVKILFAAAAVLVILFLITLYFLYKLIF